jgi:predicted nucleotidyltransferase
MNKEYILGECKKILKNHYGSRFHGLFLYGSMARGREEKSSDMDLLVMLSSPFDYFVELRNIVELLYLVQLESEHLISAKPVSEDDFESGSIHLYRVAKREGIAAQA